MTEKQNPDEILLKHVNAVALMPARGSRRISVLGRKLFNILLLRAQKEGEQEEYSAKLHEIIGMLGSASNNTAPVKKVLLELMTTTVEWQSPSDRDIETWDACNLISGAGLSKDQKSKSVTVRWRFDSRVRSQLLYPDRYAQLSVQYITQLSTHSAVALYEICGRYVGSSTRKTAREHWNWWRPVLIGTSTGDEYLEYRFFKRDIVKKSIAEINAITNLEIKLIEFKENDNKTISDIQFEVKLKSIQAVEIKPLANILSIDLETIGRGITYGVSQTDMERLLEKYNSQQLNYALGELAKRLAMPEDKVGKVSRPGSWLKAILVKLVKESIVNKVQKLPKIAKVDIVKQKNIWTTEWLRRQREVLIAGYQESNEDVKEDLLKSFAVQLDKISQPLILKQFVKSGWDHRMVRETFIQFIGSKMMGDNWDKPSTDDLFAIAAELAQ